MEDSAADLAGRSGGGGKAGSSTSTDAQAEGGPLGDAGAVDVELKAPTNVMLAFVHASPNLWPFRVCLKDGNGGYLNADPLPSGEDGVMPHSNKVGVAPGSALLVEHAEQYGAGTTFAITAVFVRASAIVNKTGDVCSTTGFQDLDKDAYFEFEATKMLGRDGQTVSLYVLHGCIAGSGSTLLACGTSASVDGNLQLARIPTHDVPFTEPNEGKARIELAHLSPSADSVFLADAGTAASLKLMYGVLENPAQGVELLSKKSFISSGDSMGESLIDKEIDIPGISDDAMPIYGLRGFTLLAPGTSTQESALLSISLATVQDLSNTKALPHTFWNDSSDFLVALLGDATNSKSPLVLPDGGGENPYFDGYGLHMIAIPLRPRAGGSGGSSSGDSGSSSADGSGQK